MSHVKLSGDQTVFSDVPTSKSYIRAENSYLDMSYEQYQNYVKKVKPKGRKRK